MATQGGPVKVIGIGLPHSGEEILPALFAGSGHVWLHHRGGKLAQNLAYAKAAGEIPFADWPEGTGFSGIYHLHKRHLPPLMLRDYLPFLRDTFPDAYFIHMHRDPADWVAAQFWASDGDHRTACAWHGGIHEAELPAHWLEEHATYADLCHDVFANHSRYIDFNVTTQSTDILIKFLRNDFDLSPHQPLPDVTIPSADIDAVLTHLDGLPPPHKPTPADLPFAALISNFCKQTQAGHSKPKVLSSTTVTWAKDHSTLDRLGNPHALMQDNGTGPYLLKPDSSGAERGHATLNDLIAHGAKPPLHIDMMDARFLGTEDHRRPPRRTIAYNRREGAQNITLWPLPGYHTLAPTGTLGGFPVDKTPFANKEDRCVWLGNLTGRMSGVLTPEGRAKRNVYGIRDHAKTLAPDSPEWADIIDDLDCLARYRVVKTLRDHPDFEVGLVLSSKWQDLTETPALAGFCVPKQPREFFHKFRYILSLAGNDTGSNFLLAASSNSLILKEEDGWEVFYTAAFKPWVHYVPLEEGAQDIQDKLRWARANPSACAAIVDAASEVYNRLVNPNTRRAYLTAIAQELNKGL